MPELWTGDMVKRLHMERITQREVAKELGVTHQYVSMVLNGAKRSSTMQSRMNDAIERIIARRGSEA